MTDSILALDPGTDKLGVAVLSDTKKILFRSVVERAHLASVFQELMDKYSPKTVVLGNGTGSQSFIAELKRRELLPAGCKIVLVDEYRTSEEARKMYLSEHRRGWRRLVPIGLQTPAVPYDDYVAIILGERYLNSLDNG